MPSMRRKVGGRESGDDGRRGVNTDTINVAAANPAAMKVECPDGRHILCVSEVARVCVLEEENRLLQERIRELEARIALMEQATCDLCGHKFYALETGE